MTGQQGSGLRVEKLGKTYLTHGAKPVFTDLNFQLGRQDLSLIHI